MEIQHVSHLNDCYLDMKRNHLSVPLLSLYTQHKWELRFFFDTDLVGVNVELIYDEMAIFSTHIDENGSVELPESLEGEFELRLYVGENVFSGLIVL